MNGKNSRIAWLWVAAAVAVAGAAYWVYPLAVHSAARAILDAKTVKPARIVPDFVLPESTGRQVHLSDFHGKVVLLNFWATWCGPCKTEIPWFVEFEKTYRDRGFTVLGVSMDEDGWKVVKPYMAEEKINYPVLLGNEKVNYLFGGIDSLPSTILVRRDGTAAHVHVGLVSREQYRKEIEELIE